MEFKTDALLIRSADYGENDKMVTLLTAARGKLGAAMKGVRKAGAKLRFAAQPFCFAEYVLAEKGGRYTVTSAALYDGFFSLREDISAFYAASAVAEVCDKLMYEGMEGGELLVAAVTALEKMQSEDISAALVGFLIAALRLAGYTVRAEACPFCGKPLHGRMRFDMESGAFCCEDCGKGVPSSESTYLTISRGEGGKDGQKRALRLLGAYIFHHTDAEISALTEYLRLL